MEELKELLDRFEVRVRACRKNPDADGYLILLEVSRPPAGPSKPPKSPPEGPVPIHQP